MAVSEFGLLVEMPRTCSLETGYDIATLKLTYVIKAVITWTRTWLDFREASGVWVDGAVLGALIFAYKVVARAVREWLPFIHHFHGFILHLDSFICALQQIARTQSTLILG